MASSGQPGPSRRLASRRTEETPQLVDEAACLIVRENYTTNAFRAEQAAAYMNNQNETCLSDPTDQCILGNAVTPAGLPSSNATCRHGNVADYHVEVTGPQDVIIAFDLANTYGFPLSIKNSGRDYMTRSGARAAAGSASVELTSDWKRAWWGDDNYELLLETKARYDPHNTLRCWKCVGWDEQEPVETVASGYDFECLGGLQDQIDQALSGYQTR